MLAAQIAFIALVARIADFLLLVFADAFVSGHLAFVVVFLVVGHGAVVVVVGVDHDFAGHWHLLPLPSFARLAVGGPAVLLLQNGCCTVLCLQRSSLRRSLLNRLIL